MSEPSPPIQLSRRRRGGVIAFTAAALALAGCAIAATANGSTRTTGIFADDLAPQVAANEDRASVELGVKFRPQSPGRVTALQYYQGAGDTGITQATLWSATGEVLARADFQESRTVGWRTVALKSTVSLDAGKTYVASYHAPRGGYPSIGQDLTAGHTQNGFSLPPNAGVYAYGSKSALPTSTWRGTNYLVDIVYRTSASSGPTSTGTSTPTSSSPTKTATSSPTSPTTTRSTTTSGGIVVLGRSFPSAATTGVPPGTSLSTYTGPCSIQTDHVVIDAKTINCDLRILAQGVTIKNSVINGTIYSDPDYFNGSFTLTDSEVRMPQTAGTGIGDVNFVVTRVEVTGGSRSINCAANCTVQDSYLHGQYTDKRGIDHESAIRMGANSIIRHNTMTCDATPVPPDAGCSAALTGYGDFAIVQKNTIDGNLIDGGPFGSMGYCAYGGSTTGKPYSKGVNNIKFTNNIFMRGPNGKCGIWGPITSFDTAAPGNVWSNNVWNDGKSVPPSN